MRRPAMRGRVTRRTAVVLAAVTLAATALLPAAGAADPATERVLASTEILMEGTVGDLVADLQRALAGAGHDPGPVDGIFGPLTAAGVRSLQDAAGITPDGIVGPATRDALGGAGAVPAGPQLAPGSGGSAVIDLQEELARAGFYRGPVDGGFGPLTASAVLAFHKIWGLERTAVWSPSDWDRLSGWYPAAPGYGWSADRIEVDLDRQVLFFLDDGVVTAVMPVSAGSGEYYTSHSGARVPARTPHGDFAFFRNVDGWDVSYLGELFEPWYFSGGYALHGSYSVPAYPVSHGCIRVSIADARWLDARLRIGMPIHVRG